MSLKRRQTFLDNDSAGKKKKEKMCLLNNEGKLI